MKTFLILVMLLGAFSVSLHAQDEVEGLTIDDSETSTTMEPQANFEEGEMDSIPVEEAPAIDDSSDYEVID